MKYSWNRLNIRLFTKKNGVAWWEISWIPCLGSKYQISQMTCIVINIGILIKYFVPTRLLKLGCYLVEPK
jgi:hypothetical protein